MKIPTSHIEDTMTRMVRYMLRQLIDGKSPEIFDAMDDEQREFITSLRNSPKVTQHAYINAFFAEVSNG